MVKIQHFFKKLRRYFKRFKKDERGGEMINQLLMLAISLLLIALILFLAMDYFNKAKESGENLFDIDDNEESANGKIGFSLDARIFSFANFLKSLSKILDIVEITLSRFDGKSVRGSIFN